MGDVIEKAAKWSALLWSQANLAWTKRRQDHNYRHYIAQPGIWQSLSSLELAKRPIVVDLGCSEGKETSFIAQALKNLGFQPEVYGFDLNIRLTGKVKNINFDRGNLLGSLDKYRLRTKVDLLTSIFVLQELPQLSDFFQEVKIALSPTGRAIFLLVHPDFAITLQNKSALVMNQDLGSSPNVDWEFAAAYPIVEENGKNFFLPYFHRTQATYVAKLSEHFRILSSTSLQLSSKDLRYCQRHKISPFYNHPGNVYYPEITKQASSLLITVAQKE